MSVGILNESINIKLDSLFGEWNAKKSKERTGLHASGILEADESFCYRKLVLAINYRGNTNLAWTGLLRVFLEGWYVHKKWQDLYEMGEIAFAVEKTHYSKHWNLYFTPDAIIEIMNRKIVVEIKSHTMNGFDNLDSPPANAVRQAQFYMHFAGIRHGLILVENKNNQKYKTWLIEYDPEFVVKYVDRLAILKKLLFEFNKTGKLPKRCERCDFEGKSNPQAKYCEMQEVCFENIEFRNKFRRKN